MNAAWVASLVGALVTLLLGWLTYTQSRSASRRQHALDLRAESTLATDARIRADEATWERALAQMTRMERDLDVARQEIRQLREDFATAHAAARVEVHALQNELQGVEFERDQLRNRVTHLEQEVAELRRINGSAD